MEQNVLKGALNEQAKQLMDLLKEKQISVEELDRIVPMGTDFIKEFCKVLHEQISSEKEAHKISVETIGYAMSKLAATVGDKELTQEDRSHILERISQLGDVLRDIQINKQKNDQFFKVFLTGCVTFIVLVICIITGKQPPKNLKS